MTDPRESQASRGPLPSPGGEATRMDRVAASIVTHAPAGSRRGRALAAAFRLPLHAIVAWALFSWLLFDAVNAEAARGQPSAFLALLSIPAGLLVLRRPVVLGLVMAAAAVFLRALYLGVPETCDQLEVSRAALRIVLAGGNPWGFGYPESVPPGAPFPYGVLAAFVSPLGVAAEIVALGGLLVILAWQRALLTLAFLGAWVAWVELGVCGINDQVPALLLLGGLLLLERRRLSGAVLVALSAGIKPYGLAWVPPLVGYGGVVVSLVLLGGVALAWSPALLWGPRSYLDSVELARSIHPRSENTLDMPALRVLAVPVVIASLWVRRWSTAVLAGALIFVVVLFLDHWASFGYWLVVLPPVGIVMERCLRDAGARLRSAASGAAA